jgi:GTP diphosphokinase / guanosine-3',5'-bis(diphosphate) 3'-diphosphatase
MYTVDEEFEKKEIIKRYRSLLRVWNTNNGIRNKHKVRDAYILASEAHRGMRRKSGEPYIYHPLDVAKIVAGEIGLGETAIICALLHDVVEDNLDYSLDDIRSRFGEKVTYIVDGLTKIKDGYEKPQSSAQAENFKKMLLTLSDDVRVILIKLADRLHNMRTLEAMPSEKRKRIAAETLYLYAPLAHRLGLYEIKSELEDLSLKYTEPEVYSSIARKLQDTELARARFVFRFITPIKKALTDKGINFEIDSREKSVYSIWKKMQTKEIPFEEVYDIFAIRIIIDSEPDRDHEKLHCWEVYSVVSNFYNPKLNRLRDWISTPKANGYESLHTTVMSQTGQWVEVQIRTRRMHEIAERGYAAHWKYKLQSEKEKSPDSGLDLWLSKVREILTSPENNALAFLDDIRLTLFSDEVFVFTPKGEIKSLPKGSTAIDFAYNIHSELGFTCIAAKVNHQLVPLFYELKSGDQIEIISSKKAVPKEEWLQHAVTPRARALIKDALKEQRKVFANDGRTKLEQYFLEEGLEFSTANLASFMEYNNLYSHIDLYYKVSIGEIGQEAVVACCRKHAPQNKTGEIQPVLVTLSKKKKENQSVPDKPMEAIPAFPDLDEMDYIVERCCHPLPGDDIISYIAPDNLAHVHRTNCPEAIELMSRHGSRMIGVKWNNKHNSTFLSGIKTSGIDRPGLIYDVVKVTTEKMRLNIKSFHIETSGEVFEAFICIYVHDVIDLNGLLEQLKGVPGIDSTNRLHSFNELQPPPG